MTGLNKEEMISVVKKELIAINEIAFSMRMNTLQARVAAFEARLAQGELDINAFNSIKEDAIMYAVIMERKTKRFLDEII